MKVTCDFGNLVLRQLDLRVELLAAVGAGALSVLLAMGQPAAAFSLSASPPLDPRVYKEVGSRLKNLEESPSENDIELEFRRHASRWKKETSHHSAVSQRKKHPSYQAILKMGPPALPLIVEEMVRRPSLWVDALKSITGEDPVPEGDIGDPRKMADAWISWSIERGLFNAATQAN